MENWSELESRFRNLAAREPDLALFASEGDNGAGYRVVYTRSKTAERELDALAASAGKLLHEVGASVIERGSKADYAQHWWRYLKNNSREVFRTSHGWSRETPDDELRHHQVGVIRNLATVCANECAVLCCTQPVRERHRFLKWLNENIVKVAIGIILGLLIPWLWSKWIQK